MVLDIYFVYVFYKLVYWVRIGNDLESGEQLVDLLEVRIIMYLLFTICEINWFFFFSLILYIGILFFIFIY